MKAYFFCTFLGYDLYFFPRFFVLFLGDEPVATLCPKLMFYCVRPQGDVKMLSVSPQYSEGAFSGLMPVDSMISPHFRYP